jgi:coatomer subunit zeta
VYRRVNVATGDIILYDGRLAVYKHSLDVIMYFIADPEENELMLSAALNSLSDAFALLLRNAVEKRGVLENLDLVLLCLDETVDDGCVRPLYFLQRF